MVEWLTYFRTGLLDRVLKTGVQLDWVMFWEDMAYNAGPLISPGMFKKYCIPFYEKVMEKVNAAGITVAMVDSDILGCGGAGVAHILGHEGLE